MVLDQSPATSGWPSGVCLPFHGPDSMGCIECSQRILGVFDGIAAACGTGAGSCAGVVGGCCARSEPGRSTCAVSAARVVGTKAAAKRVTRLTVALLESGPTGLGSSDRSPACNNSFQSAGSAARDVDTAVHLYSRDGRRLLGHRA